MMQRFWRSAGVAALTGGLFVVVYNACNYLTRLRSAYRARAEAMDQALHRHLSGIAQWRKPQGGYFVWVELAEGADTQALRRKAADYETGFQSGAVFSSRGQFAHCLRLCFAHYAEPDIAEGIARLAVLLRESPAPG